MSKVFNFIHPVLPLAAGMFVALGVYLSGEQGGPCSFSVGMLIMPILLLWVLFGAGLSLRRTFRYHCQRKSADIK